MSADDLALVIAEAVGDVNEGEPLTANQWRYVAQRALDAMKDEESA
jgi:hypothetical protein